jgi:molybdopterin biosynthesis enzyme
VSPLVPIDEVLGLTLGATAPLEPVVVELDESLGCVLAEMVIAADDVPPFSNSSMDGYAVRSADTLGAPVVLRVVDTALAGRPSSLFVGAGEAIRIMTGAVLPSTPSAWWSARTPKTAAPPSSSTRRSDRANSSARPAMIFDPGRWSSMKGRYWARRTSAS